MFVRVKRIAVVAISLSLTVGAATACSAQDNALGVETTSASSPTSTTSMRARPSGEALPDLPVVVEFPQVFRGTTDSIHFAGTYMHPNYCTIANMAVSVFDTETGATFTASGPEEQLEAAGERISHVHCAISRLSKGALYITYGVNSFTDASGLRPLEEHFRAYTYKLGSTTPKIVELPEFISSVTGTTAGPVFQTDDGEGTSTIRRYDVDGETPVWTEVSTDFGVEYSDSASVTLSDTWGARRVLDAETGEQLLSYCNTSMARESRSVALFRTDGCDPPPLAERGQYLLYDLEKQRPIGTVDGEVGKLADSDNISGHYIAFFNKHEPGLVVIDRRTGDTVISKLGEDAKSLNLADVSLFDDRLYLTTKTGTNSVVALPGGETIAENVRTRPVERLFGWTRVARAESAGHYEYELVRDVDGRYPGPWN